MGERLDDHRTRRRRRTRIAVAKAAADWPATLRALVRAAEAECPPGHAEALAALTNVALRKVPARGVFDPGAQGEHDLFVDIEAVARSHLELSAAEAAWRVALASADLSIERRDAIERAAVQVQTSSDTAYFYAGLAFGLVFVCAYRA